ncbi:MAG: 23S rRNA (uracil(1939)-C(5))-methyltransferase RlmD [Deltaproteobacteria bacterium]|nr:23S rRNA (uracil(1939)-C(5))-methyltransferase RlmD [Deltaproteobacteria bacterium]MBW2068172.1 23S rRNA (uracil(1939)-C(5))-methyltransferase RlmD [Deltaproteobacteria bacterium]
MKRGTELTLRIDRLALGGKGIASVNGFVVFVSRGLPGQLVRVRITKKKKNYAEAEVLKILERSPHECEPRCAHQDYCGGCIWQRLKYEKQIEWKLRHVREALEHIAGITSTTIHDITPSPQQWYYRNKMEFTFSAHRWYRPDEIQNTSHTLTRGCGLGLHVSGTFDRVFNLNECHLESPAAVKILKKVRDFCLISGFSAYHIRKHTGFWRFLVIREGKRTGERMVYVITTSSGEGRQAVERLAHYLEQDPQIGPEITTFVHGINDSKAQVATAQTREVLWGNGTISEKLGNLIFSISPNSFFQTNPLGVEKLYDRVLSCADPSGSEIIWDLYCGTGSITLYLAKHCRRAIGMEIVEDAVIDAYKNAELNGIDNCSFRTGDIKDLLKEGKLPEPDIVVTDPPRAGMHPTVVKALLELEPNRIVFVSCNPATLARDVGMLSEKYEVSNIYPFDLFPHTPHIECVALLKRKHSRFMS